MKRILAVAAVASWSLVIAPGRSEAQTVPRTVTTYAFTAVDALTVDHLQLQVTGVLEGEPAASTTTFRFDMSGSSSYEPFEQRQSCERLAVVAMAKPGAYRFSVKVDSHLPDRPVCTLSRVAP